MRFMMLFVVVRSAHKVGFITSWNIFFKKKNKMYFIVYSL